MKSVTLLLLRSSIGLLLVIWGSMKLIAPQATIGVSEKYYGGIISADALQTPLGAAQVALGLLVILGLGRKFIYPINAVVLVGGALAIWKYLADPLGLYLLDQASRNVLFFPSTTVAIASVIMIAFKEYDTLSLDRYMSKLRRY